MIKKKKNIYLCSAKTSGSTSRSGNDTLTVETGVRIPYPIQRRQLLRLSFLFYQRKYLFLKNRFLDDSVVRMIFRFVSIAVMDGVFVLLQNGMYHF